MKISLFPYKNSLINLWLTRNNPSKSTYWEELYAQNMINFPCRFPVIRGRVITHL